ncbi:MAG: hypothetical protein A3B81_04775 [Candidatus Muproteobacteria bacterium RIFCSPHIGHO2_02_FULL_65_16]|uniref:Antitoxin n=1 Tax=Candidatus Muproteobacteria bacterium RIFCSPHIGHO2_02_FULL_65_16 TaxID=1817766 RepID=A0A1F6U6R2_9PROT|nr:MAG: hypothetical protein A3B81_04775 [Candidatus Muproteobacteria bacterium RIFCSPHIGHO2_02_FULL_65_16]
MATTKLTLLIEKSTAARAKRYSKRHRTSISRLVSHMLAKLPNDEDAGLTPGVRRLVGLLPRTVSVEEHRRHLRGKYKL